MSPKALVLWLASAALGATEVSNHIFPFSMPDASGSAPLAYSDMRRFDHHCFAFTYAVFDKKRVAGDESNQAFLERALPLCNGLLAQTECLFSLSELYKVRKGQGAKGSKKEWCQGLYEKVAGVEMPATTTTKVSTTSKASTPKVKATTAAPKVKSTTAAAMPRVKYTTTPSAPLIKSTTAALARRIKSTTSAPQSRVKSTVPTSTTMTTTSTTTTSTTTTTTSSTTTTTRATTAITTSTTTTTTVAIKRSVKAGVDFMKHLRPPVAPLASRAAPPAVFAKSSTATTTTTSTSTAATTRAAKPSLNAGVDFMRHLRSARALVAKASTTTTSSWPDTSAECVCFHRDGERICNCPEGKSPPPEGLVQGKLLAAAAEAHTPAPQLTPEQVIKAENRESELESAESLFGAATKAASRLFGAFFQRM